MQDMPPPEANCSKDELCEYMIKCGRVKPHSTGIIMYRKNGKISYAIRKFKNRDYLYWQIMYKGIKRHLSIAKLVWLAHGNKLEDGKTIDHINRDSMDNRIQNLRLANIFEQRYNQSNLKTTHQMREQMRKMFFNGEKTIRGMAKEYGLCREVVQDIVHSRYQYDKAVRNGILSGKEHFGFTQPA